MARRPDRLFVCQSCGAVHPRWAGKCDACGGWNSIVEETPPSAPPGAAGSVGAAAGRSRGKRLELVELDLATAPPPRLRTGIDELDRVLGGGIVAGAAVLIGGDPGIGKSTLTLQAAASLSLKGQRVVYVTGEESLDQVRLRAIRLGLARAPIHLASATSVGEIVASLDGAQSAPAVLVIDSVQTMYVDGLEAAPGTVSQLRASTDALVRFAKRRGTAVLLIGHVTKEGQIAGPRVLEHMVDAVLYFEGERGHQFRVLRAVKNRYGPANEIGVFEMGERGLEEVANPSALFLAERDAEIAGAAVFAGIEGSRPVLVEVQALTAPTSFGTPRRAVVGWDTNRLAMLLAVLEARCGLVTATRDVYLNVAGGLRVQEPAADLAVAAAIVSSELKVPAPPGAVFFGEVGLAGEVRAVGQAEARLKEAAKLGFRQAVTPRGGKDRFAAAGGMDVRELGRLMDLFPVFGAGDFSPQHQQERRREQRATA
jgi:DNA repair protein RadA/Sms